MSTNSVNKGNQLVSFDYRQEARAKLFNRLLSNLLPFGIYYGGVLTRSNETQIQISPLVCLIKSNEESSLNITVRVETQAAQTISLESSSNPGYCNINKPYIVLRFGWSDQEQNFMDMIAVEYSDSEAETDANKILPNDLIAGKVLFTNEGGGNYIIKTSDSFDSTKRSNAFIPDSILAFRELRVSISESNSRKVYVSSGSINTSQGRKEVPGGSYPTGGVITDTTSQGRIDLVYVDEDGVVQIEEGTPAANPVAPSYQNKKVIAEINRGANRSSIIGTDIRQVNTTRQGMITAADFAIEDVGDYYIDKNIEDALQEIYEYASSFLAGEGTSSDDSVKDYHIDWGTGSGQVSAGDMPIADAGGRYSALEIESALQEIAGSGRTTQSVKDNADNIAQNVSDISDNTGDISINAGNISTNTNNLSTHISKDATVEEIHGVREYIRTQPLIEWQSDVTYSQNDVITAGGAVYASVQNSNTNHDPTIDDGTWWTDVAGTEAVVSVLYELAENMVAGQIAAIQKAHSAQAEETKIICVSENSGNLDGVYFDLTHSSVNYRIWFDTDNGSSAPAAEGRTLLEVDVSTGDSADDVAAALHSALDGTGNFNLTLTDNIVYVENDTTGEVEKTINEDTPFTFVQEAQGRDLTTGNKAIIADKRYADKKNVIGICTEDGSSGETKSIQKIAKFTDAGAFISLTEIGDPCFLGDDGELIQNEANINIGEYRVQMGHAKGSNVIDILLGEPALKKITWNPDDYSPRPWNKSFAARVGIAVEAGTADSDVAMKLVCSTGSFLSTVSERDVIYNHDDNAYATVLLVIDDTTLWLDSDAFPDGNEQFTIYSEPVLEDGYVELTGALLDGNGIAAADTDTANHLLDADGTDWTTIISVGDWVMNLNTGLVAYVPAVAAHDLTLNWDCFPNGNEPYAIFSNWITINDAESLINGFVIPEVNISGRHIAPGLSSITKLDAFQHWQLGMVGVNSGGSDNFFGYGLTKDYVNQETSVAGFGSIAFRYTAPTHQGASYMAKAMNDGTHGDPRTGPWTDTKRLLMPHIMKIK